MLAVGGSARDAYREEREQRRDEIGGRVGRLGDQPEAVGEQSDDQLDRDERSRGGDRDQSGALRG